VRRNQQGEPTCRSQWSLTRTWAFRAAIDMALLTELSLTEARAVEEDYGCIQSAARDDKHALGNSPPRAADSLHSASDPRAVKGSVIGHELPVSILAWAG
jgi:hypothetical protein